MDTASAIIREVGSPRLKILCDVYHFGVMGADLRKIVTNHLATRVNAAVLLKSSPVPVLPAASE
jgi:hydroxypyruvate isomerase